MSPINRWLLIFHSSMELTSSYSRSVGTHIVFVLLNKFGTNLSLHQLIIRQNIIFKNSKISWYWE